MINQAIHTLDLMQYFADSPIKSIKGSITQLLDYGLDVEDTASAKIAFENGAAGLFSATVAGYEDHSVELDVCCERASFHICDGKLTMRQGEEQTLLASDGNAYSGKKCYGNSHSMLIHHFYQALEQGRGWYIPPGEGVTVMRMIDAIRESSDTGKTIML